MREVTLRACLPQAETLTAQILSVFAGQQDQHLDRGNSLAESQCRRSGTQPRCADCEDTGAMAVSTGGPGSSALQKCLCVWILTLVQAMTSAESLLDHAGFFVGGTELRTVYAAVDEAGKVEVVSGMDLRLLQESSLHSLAGTHVCTCEQARKMNCDWIVTAGFSGLKVLKTTQSGYEGFLKDKYTMLKDTKERIVATSITASWRCRPHCDLWSLIDHGNALSISF